MTRSAPRHPTARIPRLWILLCATALAGGCGGSDQASGGGERSILRVAYTREIDVLNALTSQNLVDIEFSMVEGLITTDEHNNYVPVLALEIPTEANGGIVARNDGGVDMTWRLHEGVRWHDGEPFTAEDVCFTWRFVTSPGSQVYNRDQYLGIVGCDSPNETVVVFHWDGHYAYYAGLFEAILPEHVFRGMSTEQIVRYEPYNRGPGLVGTGPFRFAEWRSGEYIRVVRNDDYWRGPEYPAIDEIVWAFIPDSNTRLNALKASGYHYGQVEPTRVSEIESNPGYEVHLISSNSVMHLDVNVGSEKGRVFFGDVSVRRALFHAIDRRAIADQLMQGAVQVANSPLNTTNPYFNSDLRTYPFDPAMAARMLDDVGWAVGPEGVRVRDGQRFAFTMLNRAGTADRIAVAQVIQAQLRDVGIEVTFETLENAAWTQRWRSGRWEALVSAWFLPADPSLTNIYSCHGANNMTGLCDATLDEVLEASDRELSFERRKPLLDRAQAVLAESAFSLPLYYNVIPEVVSTSIRGYRGSGTNFGSFWNLWQWALD